MRTQSLSALPSLAALSRRIGVVLLYMLVFTVAVPLVVWALGTKMDALLRPKPMDTLRAPGLVLLSAGLALWLLSHLWFSAATRGLPISGLPPNRLVTTGPYAWLRHPIYVGFTMGAAGFGCTVRSLGHGLLAPLILATACWAYVTSYEAPVLRRRYGSAYGRVGRAPRAGQLLRAGAELVRSAAQFIANHPVLLRLGPTVWASFGLFLAMGAFLVALLGSVLLGPLCSPGQYFGFAIGLALAMAGGARLLSLVYNFGALRRRGWAELRVVGFVSWGGYLGLLVFVAWFGRTRGISALVILDRLSPLLFLCMAFGRVGCLSYGCCFGLPSVAGVRWTHPQSKVVRLLGTELGALPRAPIQLSGALLGLFGSALAGVLLLRHGAVGTASGFSVLWYCLARLGVEQSRDESRFGRLQWTRGQWLAAGVAGSSLAFLLGLPATSAVAFTRSSLDLTAVGTSVVVAGLVFIIYGLHWRRLGSW